MRSQAFRYLTFLALAVLISCLILIALSLTEWWFFGEHQLGVRKRPLTGHYHVARFVFACLMSVLIVVGLYRLRGEDARINYGQMDDWQIRAAYGLLAAAASCTVLFVVDPTAFRDLALEDNGLEWISAFLPLAASGIFALAFVRVWRSHCRDSRRRVALVLTPLLSAILFIFGMEEISWMQRIFQIETPALFQANQQGEMNLHNMHNIAIALAHHLVMFAWLIALPFIIDTAPQNRLRDLLSDFLPSRFILAVSAPWAAFNYNTWNFFGTQIIYVLTVAIVLCQAVAAYNRRDRAEAILFSALTGFILVAQPLFLATGENFVRMWDASEYMELFIAVGLALFAWETLQRLNARYKLSS